MIELIGWLEVGNDRVGSARRKLSTSEENGVGLRETGNKTEEKKPEERTIAV